MFSSADGYCSAVVFANDELGIQQERTEQDVEMMDIPSKQIDEWAKPMKRKASLVELPTQTTLNVVKTTHVEMTSPSTGISPPTTPITHAEKPKKRRITPILISTPHQ